MLKLNNLNWKKIFSIGAIGLLLGGLYGVFIYTTTELPEADEITSFDVSQSTKLYDRDEEVLFYEIYREEKRTIITADNIPEIMRQATLAIEDDSFYEHGPFDWRGLVRAMAINLIRGSVVQGGSTITQQLAKNTFLTPERTLNRKLREAVLAIKLEQTYSKDDILNFYLNQVPYGPNIYGIESASRSYFDKGADELNINEAATLAALPKAPSYYSPWGVHQDDLKNRKNWIVDRMLELGNIDEQEAADVPEELPDIKPQPENSIQAPHFAIAVQEYLRDKYGEEVLRTGGLKVTTTLDWDMQTIAETAVSERVARNQEIAGSHNGALLAMDPKTGQILAMVGSKDYFGESEPEGCIEGVDCAFEGNFNVALQGLRQPGSAFKPFAYLTAFKNGLTPDTFVWDVSTEFSAACPPTCYRPVNFDGVFRGPVTLKQALAQSINVPAVKALYLAGLSNTSQTAADFGITTFNDPERFGLSLVLGGGEVRMVELLTAYSTLANEGVRPQPGMILKVEDAQGNVLEEYEENNVQVVDPQYPRLVNNILSSAELRSGLFTASLPLTQVPGYQVALKTGTTNDYVDAWTIGYTPNLVAGVWAGNNNRQALSHSGSSLVAALPMWHDFMSQALPKLPVETFNRPDPVSGNHPMLNGKIIEDEYHSILHYLDRVNDSQYINWENAIDNWLSINPEPKNIPSVDSDDVGKDKISIDFIDPENGDSVDNSFLLEAEIESDEDIKRIRVYLDGDLVFNRSGNLDNDFLLKEEIDLEEGKLQSSIRVEVEDEDDNELEEEIVVYQ